MDEPGGARGNAPLVQRVNFAAGRTAPVARLDHLYFLAVMLAPDDLENLDGLRRGDIEWRFLALRDPSGAPLLVAFTSMNAVMGFGKVGGGAPNLPRATEIIRTDTAILRDGPCPYDIWLNPTADDLRALERAGGYTLLEEGLESLL
ncbi:MAG: hypothetical protein U0641_17040 [Anaerolineae bacterium]